MSTTTTPARRLDSPRLVPLLPLIYVAWADGDLTSAEIERIREVAATQDFLDSFSTEQLDLWLDPANPPTPLELRQLLRRIQRAAANLGDAQRRSLADLGMALARHDHDASGGDWLDGRTHDALRRVENALGVAGAEAARELLPPAPPHEIPGPVEARAGFDVARMTVLLDGDHHERRNEIRKLLREPAFRYQYDDTKAEHRERVLGWLQELARRGYGRLAFPSIFGEARDLGEFISVFETLGYFDLSLVVKFGVQLGLFGGSIYFLGTERHHQRYLEDVAAARLLGCFAMTEHGHGSNVRDLETIARYDAATDELVIHSPSERAGKQYIGNAACHAQMATVFAQLEVDGERYGVHAVLVPIRDAQGNPLPGVRIEDTGHKMGLNGVDNGQLWFDQVRVPRDNLLDRFGRITDDGRYESPIVSESRRFFTMLAALVAGRVSVGSAGLSAARSALAIAVHYGAARRQFGSPGQVETAILDYPTHQRRLMPLLARTYALTFALHDLAGRYADHASATRDPGEDDEAGRQIEAEAAGLKALATWHATQTLQVARECCGGNGYLSINRLGPLKADSDIFTTFEGDNTVLMQLVAKGLLTSFRKQFNDNRVFAMLRFVAAQATTAITERNPVVTRRTDREHLRDPEFQHAALRYRESDQLAAIARKLQRLVQSGVDANDAFLQCQVALVDLARAHVERIVLERFDAAIERTNDPGGITWLRTLRDLYALDAIERDLGYFLEEGYLEANKARAIRAQIDELCAEVRTQAVHLVDAFAIPDEALAAPIALDGRGW